MLKRKVLFTVVLSLCILHAYGQDDSRTIMRGTVENAETREGVPFVHVLNSTAHQGTTTDGSGAFMIPVMAGDTLNFSVVGYESLQYIAGEQVPGAAEPVRITLRPSTVELKEVEVFAYRDAEALKDAILNLELPDTLERVVIPGAYTGPRREYRPNPLKNPISFAFGGFNKQTRERIKLAEAKRETARWRGLREKVDFIRETADIAEEEIDEFLQFCNLDYNKIEASTEYELALAVNHCIKDYKENR